VAEFISRRRELAEVLEGLQGRLGSARLIIGERGAGRSALLRAVADTVETPSMIVAANPGEEQWPRSGLFAVLGAVDQLQGTDLRAVVAEHEESSAFRLARSLHAALHESLREPLLILVDDAEWLDAQSQEILGYLFRRAGGTSLRVVLSLREDLRGTAFSGIPTLHLAPLSTPAMIALARELVGPRASPTTLEITARTSEGNPLALASILGALSEAELDGSAPLGMPLRPGRELAEAVGPWLRDLGRSAQHALQRLAASNFLTSGMLERLPEITVEAVDELVAADIALRLGDVVSIRGGRVAVTAYWAMTPQQRIAVHEELAEASRTESPGLHAWHRSFVDPWSIDPVALLAEARDRVEAGMPAVAACLAERSLIAEAAPAAARESLIKSLLLDGELGLARGHLHHLLASAPGGVAGPSAGVLRVLLDFFQLHSVDAEAVRAMVAAHSAADPAGCARLLGTVATVRIRRFETDLARAEIARARALVGRDDPVLAEIDRLVGLAAAALAGEELPEARELERCAERARGTLDPTATRILTAFALTLAERYEEARGILDLLAESSGTTPALWTVIALDVRFTLDFRSGDISDVRATLAEIRDRDRFDGGTFPVSAELRGAELALVDGDLSTARGRARATLRMMSPGVGPGLRSRALLVLARAAMRVREHDTAVQHFDLVDRIAGSLAGPQLLRCRDDQIEALHRSGRTARAREVLDRFREEAGSTPSRWSRLAVSRSRALLLEAEESLALLDALLADWPLGEEGFLHVRTLHLRAERRAELGDVEGAAHSRAQAAEVLREMGCERLAAELAEQDAVTEQLTQRLTSSERAVVDLLVKGYKNRTIARDLFLSTRTVELRLTNVYRKAGVRSRFELLRLLTDAEEE
jgi:DNA-binding CsgD family transcriptional regulator